MSWDKRFASHEEAWKAQYRLRPYLANAPESELQDRLEYILRNVLTISPEGKIEYARPEHGRAIWLHKTSDLNQELWRRNREPIKPQDFPGMMPFDNEALALVKRNAALAKYVGVAPVFGRYDDLQYARQLRRFGVLRIRPASDFENAALGHARHARELSLETVTAPCDYDLGLVGEEIRRRYPERQWIRYVCHKPSDFYMYCLTTSFDFRYFLDFTMDPSKRPTCLLIRDQDEFRERIISAAKKDLPGWTIKFGPVQYVEPYSLGERITWAGQDIYFFKHHRHLYQREHRLVCIPPVGAPDKLTPRFLTLGSLKPISELLTLDC